MKEREDESKTTNTAKAGAAPDECLEQDDEALYNNSTSQSD